jgi:glycosyltransferase involved in cell wall biosynthesis
MADEAKRRLLIVSHFHPPCPGPGGSRWNAMAKYLKEPGYGVTVVGCDAWGVLPTDAEQDVIRVTDLRSSKLLRRAFRRGKLPVAGDPITPERPPGPLITKVFVPDMHVVTWLPQLVSCVRRLLRERHFDCLITTSPPEAVHLVGLMLGSARPAWIADFRDGWGFEPWREPFPTRAQQRLDAWLERRVAGTAEATVGATRPIADDLHTRLGSHSSWVPNGWDPSSFASPPARTAVTPTPSSDAKLVYTGTLFGPWGRDPEPLLRALQVVRQEAGERSLRLVHAGNVTTHERELIRRAGVENAVEHLGMLDRISAHELQKTADALLLITSAHRSEATSKLFEYIAAGRPIVALADGNEAERIVRETNAGITVAPGDVDAIASALRQVVSGELVAGYAPRNADQYVYPTPAETMARTIDAAVEKRAASID